MDHFTNEHEKEHGSASEKIPAAAYVRMSTDHQQYSTNNQSDIITKYAEDIASKSYGNSRTKVKVA